jgi:hypothetical protein
VLFEVLMALTWCHIPQDIQHGGRNIQTVRSRSRYKMEYAVSDHTHERIHSGIKGKRKLMSKKKVH